MHSVVRPEKITELECILRKSQNFFKHADKDFDKKIDFNPEVTPYLLLDAISNFYQLTAGFTLPMYCLKLFLLVENPGLIIDEEYKELVLDFKSTSNLKRGDYWIYLHEACAK